MSLLNSITDYENFIYTIQQKYPEIKVSTLVLKRLGLATGYLIGKLSFEKDITLSVRELVDFDNGTIDGYSYEVGQGNKKLYYYDPQPHPDDPTLAATFPHHKHVPPNIKRNRIKAENISLDSPNLPFLIREIKENLLEGK